MEYILSVKNLKTDFVDGSQIVHAVNDVSFDIREGETFGTDWRERMRQKRYMPLDYRIAEGKRQDCGGSSAVSRPRYHTLEI